MKEISITNMNLVIPMDYNNVLAIVEDRLSDIHDDDEKMETVNHLNKFSIILQQVTIDLLNQIHKMTMSSLQKTFQYAMEQIQDNNKNKKERYSSKEVGAIIGKKSPTTILKYFQDGTIVAHKDKSGNYYVLRQDLANYLGYDNF